MATVEEIEAQLAAKQKEFEEAEARLNARLGPRPPPDARSSLRGREERGVYVPKRRPTDDSADSRDRGSRYPDDHRGSERYRSRDDSTGFNDRSRSDRRPDPRDRRDDRDGYDRERSDRDRDRDRDRDGGARRQEEHRGSATTERSGTLGSELALGFEAPRPRRASALESNPEEKSKNKRLLGMLVGTLKQFKTEVAQPTKAEVKMKEIGERLSVQAAKEREESKQARTELFQKRNEAKLELRRLAQLKDFKINSQAWEAHRKMISNFIRTTTEPHIFYIPAVHTEKTEQLLSASASAILSAPLPEFVFRVYRRDPTTHTDGAGPAPLRDAMDSARTDDDTEDRARRRRGSSSDDDSDDEPVHAAVADAAADDAQKTEGSDQTGSMDVTPAADATATPAPVDA